MTVLWINLAIVFLFAFFSRVFAISYANIPILIVKPQKLLIIGAGISLILVSGLRLNIGDTFFYRHAYELKEMTWEMILSNKDIGFGILQMVLQQFSMDAQLLIFVTAFITNVLIIIVLYKYSRMIELSLYTYITGGLFLVSMNGIRQFLAAAIAFAATKYLIDGHFFKYTLVILFASLFHQSVLIFIPIYFISRFKAWSQATIVLFMVSLLIVIGYEQFSSLFFDAIENTEYGHYENFVEGGANIIRVLVFGVPLVVCFLGREKLGSIFPESNYFVNMSLIGLIFMIIATQNWIFARFSIYFGLYQIVLISWIVKLFNKKEEKLVYFLILVCYLGFFYYEHVLSLNIYYVSDYFK
ncbi:EpsG family protein [Bacillus carboniphilus]|uniref:EpsG family protein n=1 Tax=Bacillus carboniphilus TaxID=86663 RepID=A0ABY9JWV7_9BACI|nr:EpsG family protein [Bacillus carboniphilus]WLR42783.1 EpsG family protein [Bacillus carboniphilus]